MLKKMALAASAAVVVLGAGTAALATSTSAPTKPGTPGTTSAPAKPSTPGATSAPTKPGNPAKPGTSGLAPGAAAPDKARGPKARKLALKALGRALHAQWVTPDGDSENTFVTHNAIRGEVTAVSATSITVKALDGVTQTYAITGDTKVHLRKGLPSLGKGKSGERGNRGGLGNGPAGTISDVRTGDQVAVTGIGTTSLTAQHVVDATP
ncbi:MAG TPA: hypothetical protein VF557_13950 [Jatrophihabitans sp.]|jgi:hypothetical protein|uniref:hypothetical protein n=1 Tax=Jatrophihabitans sp. TaxID=1932789 RepID=UPI002F20C2EF